MQLFRGGRAQRLDHLITLAILLAVLLVALATFALLGNIAEFLGHFKQPIFLFVLGAIIAFILAPLVRQVERVVRRRWAAIAASYLLVFLGMLLFGVLLLSPFAQEARSLVDNLHNPAATNLQSLATVRKDLGKIQTALLAQQKQVNAGEALSQQPIQTTRREITAVARSVDTLSTGISPKGQIHVPPSYVTPIRTSVSRLVADYELVLGALAAIDKPGLDRSVAEAKTAYSAASLSYQKAASTPLLLLALQSWFDGHGMNVDLHNEFHQAVQAISQQIASLLTNALGVALQAGGLLLSMILVLLISIYWVSDGARFIRWLISLLPYGAQGETTYLVGRLDGIVGTYLRTTVLLAAFAGALDATGAVVFGVPYPIVIFLSVFLLSLIPIIGSLLVYLPPMLIALVFTPLPQPVLYLLWLLIAEQLATNILGPLIGGHSIGIHPLEAMAAAFVGYPLAGVIGSLFAVPMTAFLHVCVQELHGIRMRRQKAAAAAAAGTAAPVTALPVPAEPAPAIGAHAPPGST